MPLRRLATVDPDVRIGRSLPIGKLLVTCQICAGETVSMFWCGCSLRYAILGGFDRRVVYCQESVPGVWSCLMEIGLGDFGWVGSVQMMKSFLLYG